MLFLLVESTTQKIHSFPTRRSSDLEEKIGDIPFSLSMDTIAGEISFDYTATLVLEGDDEEDQDWFLEIGRASCRERVESSEGGGAWRGKRDGSEGDQHVRPIV